MIISLRAAFQVLTTIIVKVDSSQHFAALWTSPFACWTRKVGMELEMSGEILYVCASACIKERICLY